jgi:single-strand selective monofunctional uracil DNA glycosylase
MPKPTAITTTLIDAADDLRKALRPLTFPVPVSHTYNPLDYAWERHCDYLERFGKGRKRVLFLGMNPGSCGPILPV